MDMHNQEIKVTKCADCPMLSEDTMFSEYNCAQGAFANWCVIPKDIHPNCPFENNETITFKFQTNESRD